MSDEWISVITAFIAGSAAMVGVWFNRRQVASASNRADAEAADFTVKTALTLIEPLRERIEILEARVETLTRRVGSDEKRIKYLETGCDMLTDQVIDLGGTPVWPPRQE